MSGTEASVPHYVLWGTLPMTSQGRVILASPEEWVKLGSPFHCDGHPIRPFPADADVETVGVREWLAEGGALSALDDAA